MSALTTLLAVLILLSCLELSSALKPAELSTADESNQQTIAASSRLSVSKHKITLQEVDQLTSQEDLQDNQTGSNMLVDGHGTGLSAPTSEELLEIAENAYVIDSVTYQSTPGAVDNSETPWFPPIGNQDGEGSCAAWAVGYYVKTYQEAKEHGWDLSGATWEGGTYGWPTASYQDKIMSPDFLYHLVNKGIDDGTSFEAAVDAVCFIGISSWQKMPYNPTDHSSWPSEAAWTEAMLYRGDSETSYEYLYANTGQGLTSLKNWLASGNLALIAIDANQYTKLTSTDIWTLNNYATVDLNHANTIVGYDDNITYIENGVLKQGAFKIANSWGIGGWENVDDGFYWISYETMKQLSGPDNPCVIFNDLIDYQPEIAASFRIIHNRRGECTITLGYGAPTNILASKVFSDYVLGGDKPFCQNNIVVDITEFKQYMTSFYNQPFFMNVYDGKTYSVGTIAYFAVGDSAASGTPLATRQYNTVSLTVNYSVVKPTLTVSPLSGLAEEELTLYGTNFPSGSTVNLSYLNPNTNQTIPIANNISTLTGNFTFEIIAPDLNQSCPAGDHPESYSNIVFVAIENSAGYTCYSTPYAEWNHGLTSIADVTADGLFGNNTNLSGQVFVQANQTFMVYGKYFSQGDLTAFCDGIYSMGTAAVGENGDFNVTLTMPSQVSAGVHTVTLSGTGQNFMFMVTRLPQVTSDYDGSWHSTDATVNLSADGEGVSEIYYHLNGGIAQSVGVNGQPIVTIEGSNVLEYWGIWSNGIVNIELIHTNVDVKLDKSAPEGKLEINSDAAYSSSRVVTLTVTASDSLSGLWKIRFSDDGVWNTEAWEPFVNFKTWTLTAGDGSKTVYCQIMNNAGLITSFQDAIILDTSKPTVDAVESLVIGVGAKVDFDASGSSDSNGITSYLWSFGDGQKDEGQKVSHVYSESGNYTATLQVEDAAGNNAQTEITVVVEKQNSVIPEYPVTVFLAIMLAVITIALVLLTRVKKVNQH